MTILGAGPIYLGEHLVAGGDSGGGGGGDGGYQRPADWLTLPAVNVGDQKFVGLHAVFDNESNFVAVNCAGAYTVDWGDGSAPQNVAANTQANRNVVFADLPSDSLCSRGYRQAIVTITPQAGQNLTKVDLFVKHNQAGLVNGFGTGWLDIRMAGSLVATLGISATSTTVVRHRLLEQFEYVGASAVTTCLSKFHTCTRLRSLIGTDWTAAVTDMSAMFNGCSLLESVPLFNMAAVTNMANMFTGCTALQSVPLFNTAAVTNMTTLFNGCSALHAVPLLDTSAVTSGMASMFNSCSSLRVGALSGTKVTVGYSNCMLGPAALNDIYTNLASGVTGQTITVTGNWGTTGDDPSIATAKGWTVTGS